jgi:N4-gp56 family major capsid protein
MTHVDPIIQEATKLMGENMGETMDSVYREVLVAGTGVYYIQEDDGGTYATGSARDTTDGVQGTLCKSAVDAVIRDLDGADAKHFTPMVNGSTRVNSFPIGKAYWCLIHTDQIHDLFSSNGGFTLGEEFTPVERYSNQTGVMETEVGKYRNVRFVATTNAKIWPDAGDTYESGAFKSTSGTYCDVYAALFFARDAYGVIPLQRGSGRTIVQRAGGPTDPLEQRNTVGWKGAGTAIILNDEWMRRVECASLA